MINYKNSGLAYTLDEGVVAKYTMESTDKSYEFMKIKNPWMRKKMIQFWAKQKGEYILPPHLHRVNHKKIKVEQLPGVAFREHQSEAMDYIVERYNNNKKTAFIKAGTGTGKTYIMVSALKSVNDKTVIIAPNKTISGMILADCEKYGLDASIGVGQKINRESQILIVTHNTWNIKFDEINGKYNFVILDESHHIGSDRKKGKLNRVEQLCMWEGDFILGVTATPFRKEYDVEGFKLLFGDVLDTKALALPIKVKVYKYAQVYGAEMMKHITDLSPESPECLRRFVIHDEERYVHLYHLIEKCISGGKSKIIVFVDRVLHAEKTKEKLIALGLENVYMYTGEKKEITEDTYKDGVIVGAVGCCGEGFNIPSLEVGICFHSTQREGKIDQMAGRVRRYCGEKKFGYYIDFVDKMKIFNAKRKTLGWYERKKIYHKLGRDVAYLN